MTQTPTSSLISKHYKLSTNNKVSSASLPPLSSNNTTSNNSNSSSSSSSSSSNSSSSHSNSSHSNNSKNRSNSNNNNNNHYNTVINQDNSNNKTIPCKRRFDIMDVEHDPSNYMFKLQLDNKGSTAALCYLPTRCPNIIEFYHIEIPFTYRHQGLGDLILQKAFQWAEKAKKFVIPTCPFVRKYLENRLEKCIVNQEQKTLSTSSSSIVEKEL
ncbi:hypothetical protein BCV72DRAFT_63466 [Rhizopus microsporus var. microsporus]|uniref:N-acetyltransferase domain-containing protein n=1 Tax=Rhizopus microsporus var. microsporus TaxID=86635 RepID=A0A1X0QQ45_RHIZD|nr:hypothetical protein BCV72DRAFT_63466 [Rhizopus microsporus var. microsporus]